MCGPQVGRKDVGAALDKNRRMVAPLKPTTQPFQSVLSEINRHQPAGHANFVTETAPESKVLHRYLDDQKVPKDLPLDQRVTHFQESYNKSLPNGVEPLVVDGKAGPKTLEALRQRQATTTWSGACPADPTDQAFLGNKAPTPNLNAPAPAGSLPSASVLSQTTDEGRRAKLEAALPLGDRVRATDAKVKDLENTIAAYGGAGLANGAALKKRDQLLVDAKAAQKKFEEGEPFKSVDTYRKAAAELKEAQDNRAVFDSDGERIKRIADLEQKTKLVAELKEKAAPYLTSVEAEEKEHQADIEALQHPMRAASSEHSAPKVAKLKEELAKLQSNPDYQDFMKKTQELSDRSQDRHFGLIPRTDQELLESQEKLQQLERDLARYKASPLKTS